MSPARKHQQRRMSVTITLVLLALYYAAVYRPLAQKERDQAGPFATMQAQLLAAATNSPVIAGLDLQGLVQLDAALRRSLANTAAARNLIASRFAPEPMIATNLSRGFQLIDYQNERLNRGDRLINLAGQRKVKVSPAVTAGLPEFTVENRRPELLWGQLALFDGVLRAAVEAGVESIDVVTMPEPVIHGGATNAPAGLVELPLRAELVGNFDAITRLLGIMLLDETGRQSLKLPRIEGLPGASLRHIVARKEGTSQPGTVRLIAEFSGFLLLPNRPINAGEARSNN